MSISSVAFAQNDSVYIINFNELEEIVENQEIEEDLDIDNSIDELSYLINNPYNINDVSKEQLEVMNLLNEYQLNSFFDYRNTVGPFISLYELQAVPNWNVLTIERMLPYLTLKKTNLGLSGIQDMVRGGKHLLTLRWKNIIEDREGFNKDGRSDYLGDPNHYYVRYRYNYSNKLRWGLTAEKDSGESFFKGSNNQGFDYYSGFLHYNSNEGIIQSISLGDYTISMGQGLILHNAFGSGKSTRTTNIKKSGKAIRPYSSVNEVNFFRGISTKLVLNDRLTFVPFISRKSIDGTLRQDTLLDDGFESFSSLVVDGYHRTKNEIAKENTIQQTNYGGVLSYKINNLKIGVNLLNTSFDRPLKTDDQLYRLYAFNGTKLTNISTDFNYRYKNISFFGEGARSDNGGTAYIIGSQMSLHPSLDVAFSYRDYGKEYQVLNAKAFGESINGINEQGVYLGTKLRINRELSISAYHDIWRNEWLRFRVDAPSRGKESVIRFEYYKKRKYTFYIQYKNEIKGINGTRESTLNQVVMKKTQRLRIHLNNKVNSTLELRNRIEFSHFNIPDKTSKGWLAFQDLIIKPVGSKFSFTTRFSIFDTDDFDTRIYTYENDILYEFRIPFYQNQGTRFYLNTRYKATRKLSLEFRYGRTQYNNRDEIGSSGETINGNVKSEVKVQLSYKL